MAAQFDLRGKVAIVTGAGSGIGRASALALARNGAAIVANYFKNEKGAAETVADIQLMRRNALMVCADVTKRAQVAQMIVDTLENFGRIDILVNNAGVNIRKPVEEFDEASWDLVQETNLKAPFLCSRAVAGYMKEQRYGRVINMASMIALVALPERSAYCSSKGGLIQLTRVLALEWAPYNITVNALCPGPFATEMNIPIMNNPQANLFFLDHIPLGRWGQPEELGGAIVFLASHASSFMTGAALVIDGGWTAG